MTKLPLVVFLSLIVLSASETAPCDLPEDFIQEIHSYQPIVDHIVQEIVNGRFSGQTWEALAELTDRFGPRMSGTQQLEDAIDYVLGEMHSDGLDNVHGEPALVPRWVRGYERAQLLKPFEKNLPLLGLGSSVGTTQSGILAELVVVESFTELEQLDETEVQGRIVVFAPKWDGYASAGRYRSAGASAASRKGAVATLIRSATPFSIGSPHTGSQVYEKDVFPIPTACITVEDAEMLLRIHRKNVTMKVHLVMEDYNSEPSMSRNTVGELQGWMQRNNSVVVVTGHLDSWDVGVGSMDDGGGIMIAWKALTFLKAMDLQPKRTIRALLYTAEEQGLEGEQQYFESHSIEEFNIFLESDTGTFDPRGFDFVGNQEASCIFQQVAKLMTPLNATYVNAMGSIEMGLRFLDNGVPGAFLNNANEKYFWYHHSEGDSMLVEDPKSLDKCTALWAATAYVLADLSVDLPKS
ncbi:carboxypeptidase Q-like isoform X1 [Uranotaenia lowii]|uniref:carboxypeptidase Q-like isoform X1 n=1 Tax=Uranotaenia lowii TaxID=190385 RepID=UPI002478EF9E|nr:carboxypeptidase Q-like isoform X1 [Uranotaenia lowii]